MDGCIGRERQTKGEVDSDQVGMGGLFQRERGYEREREGLCHLLCADGEGEQTSLAKKSGGDGDEEAGRERKRDKNMGGSEEERDLVPVWQLCFFYTSSVGSPFHGNPFDLGQMCY